MKIILIVGYADYETRKKFADKHPNYMFVQDTGILNDYSADVIMESVKMVDGVLFLNPVDSEKVAYEVAAVMFKKPIVTETILERAEREAEGKVMETVEVN